MSSSRNSDLCWTGGLERRENIFAHSQFLSALEKHKILDYIDCFTGHTFKHRSTDVTSQNPSKIFCPKIIYAFNYLTIFFLFLPFVFKRTKDSFLTAITVSASSLTGVVLKSPLANTNMDLIQKHRYILRYQESICIRH